ncbi:MAG: choice-of-anchor tandem repeat GloVer-containing protein [Terriglobales bacterium]
MTKLHPWKKVSAISLLVAATVITSRAQTFETLVNFDGTNGANPVYPGLVQGIDGNLYGTTLGGGANLSGTVFRLTPGGKLTTLYSFCSQVNCADGSLPQAGLSLATNGSFYGATSQGGVYGNGIVFRINTQGVLTTLHSFDYSTEGVQPFAPPIQGSDGNLYGTTTGGGPYNAGTVFKMTPDGVLTTLHDFEGDGASPLGALVQAVDGDLYGTTQLGGSSGNGTIFRITTGGTFTSLLSFNFTDGSGPSSGLIQGIDGKLYGTTYQGGANSSCEDGCGTVYRISLSGTLTTVYNFNLTDGANPVSPLVQGSDGNLYGTTYAGGSSTTCFQGCGTVYRLSPTSVLTTLHSFDLTDGAQPYGSVDQATGGNFYGTTTQGGSDSVGTVFGLSTGLGPFVSLVHNPAKVGQTFGVLGQGFSGTKSVSLHGTPATFKVKSNTLLEATVPAGATTGYVTVTTPTGTLTSNVPFYVIP